MKITRIETMPIRIPFRTAFTIAAPYEKSREHIDCLIVKIHTDEGIYGIGETQAWRRQGSSEVLLNLVRIIQDIYTPLLIGRSPLDINQIMRLLNSVVYNSLYAQAAIGDALYDLAGKYFNVPVYRLLGGKCRDEVSVGMCISIENDSRAMLEHAQKLYDEGYRHIRIKIGINPDDDVRNTKTLKDYFGDKIALRADANAGLDYPSAIRLLKKLEPYDFEMIEQPVAIWDLKGMADLCRHTSIPISADESVSHIHSLLDIIQARAACIIQTKTAKNGGLYYIRQLWVIAEAAGIRIFPGNHPTTSIGVASVTHLCAAWAGELMAGDYQTGQADVISDDIVIDPIKVKNGKIRVPELPGLGIELDEEKIKKYLVDE